jgi:predicted ATPase
VVTGGPGAGKTAILEIARRELAPHVDVLPESASIVFGGGFPRRADDASRRSSQRAIYHVQNELEQLPVEPPRIVTLCDRGTIDALAYWPGKADEFFAEVGTTFERELMRYAAVVHLRVPEDGNGYHQNALRIESARQARQLDERLLEAWARHPRRVVIDTDADFLLKAHRAIGVLRDLIDEGARSAA